MSSEILENTKDRAKVLKDFLESPAWKMVDDMLDEQVKIRRQHVLLTPLATADSIYEQEFQKGEAAGIELARNLPANILESLLQDIANQQKEIENGRTE